MTTLPAILSRAALRWRAWFLGARLESRLRDRRGVAKDAERDARMWEWVAAGVEARMRRMGRDGSAPSPEDTTP